MTQQINPNSTAQVIPMRDSAKATGQKPSIDRFTPDAGAKRDTANALSSVENGAKAKEPLERAEDILNQVVYEADMPNTRLVINQDDKTGDFIYQTLDNDTGEVIRQFPPETIMEMLTKIREIEGIAVDSMA